MTKARVHVLFATLIMACGAQAQHSVARQWNEALLHAIRNDFARPTVHARNLFHTAIATYDTWAVYDQTAGTFLLGKTVHGFTSDFNGIAAPGDITAAREEAMSYAVFRLLSHRFAGSPGSDVSLPAFAALFTELGYDAGFTSVDYSGGSPAALGNYVAQTLIDFGNQDTANEQNDYANLFYQPVNSPLVTNFSGNPDLTDPNRWQPLTLDIFIDQANNEIPFNTPPFLSPEWGSVAPFALKQEDLTVYQRDGNAYRVYHDPGAPPDIDIVTAGGLTDEYRWNFELVAIWSAHLDHTDDETWDISPASIGNVQSYPETIAGLRSFYNLIDGGDSGIGHTANPHTGLPYVPQMVKRGDYARVLAEFWADGPDSETPPGHWFTILNYVNDHAEFEKRFRGEGAILDDLEWDVKAYFALAGAVHDAAVAAWGAKGWYDYIRPISAIRSMAARGQRSNPAAPSYHVAGITLIDGYIELVDDDDPLAGDGNENVGKIKVKSWKGPDFIAAPETDVAGVDWILAENWWPYQRPTFVTPPFAGYVSGHSTFSRAAAEVMTALTGDAFFPGGMGEFHAGMNDFLVFEKGPSSDVVLQWATYRDASDQCSLSRIWGGIHPPADDIPGRLMGIEIGIDAFTAAEAYFVADDAPPTATNDTYTVQREQTLQIGADEGVLANDTDPESGPLSAAEISPPAHGALTLSVDGSFTYTPDNGHVGDDVFGYRVTDSVGKTAAGSVTVIVTETADADEDGLPNAWELKYSGSLTGLDPAGDGDGDDIPNIIEYRAQLDPASANPDAPILVLRQGWNLISMPVLNSLQTVDTVLDGTTVGTCWAWRNAAQRYEILSGDNVFSGKRGYWAYSSIIDYIETE